MQALTGADGLCPTPYCSYNTPEAGFALSLLIVIWLFFLLLRRVCVCTLHGRMARPQHRSPPVSFLPLLFPVPTSSPLLEWSHRAACSEPHGTFHGKGCGRPLIPKKAGNHVIPASLGLQPVREAPRARWRNTHPGGQSQRQSTDHKWVQTTNGVSLMQQHWRMAPQVQGKGWETSLGKRS